MRSETVLGGFILNLSPYPTDVRPVNFRSCLALSDGKKQKPTHAWITEGLRGGSIVFLFFLRYEKNLYVRYVRKRTYENDIRTHTINGRDGWANVLGIYRVITSQRIYLSEIFTRKHRVFNIFFHRFISLS